MKYSVLLLCGWLMATAASPLSAADHDYSYAEIAKRHGDVRLDDASVAAAEMHGECLVGLKELNFQKSEEFDPVADWTRFRSFSLLEQFPPCFVLITMEVARDGILAIEAGRRNDAGQ